MKKKWLLLAGGILLVALAGLVLKATLFSPSSDPSASLQKELPSGWLSETPLGEPKGERGPTPEIQEKKSSESLQAGTSEPAPSLSNRSFETAGVLAIEFNGKRSGQESYTISGSEGGGVRLTSQGKLSFKVFLIMVSATFTQQVLLDSELRPVSAGIQLKGPIGIGNRRTEVWVAGERAILKSGEQRRERQVDPDRAFIMGMFSSYALIPVLFQARAQEGVARFELLAVGGPPSDVEDDPERGSEESQATVELLGLAEIRADGTEMEVDRYRVTTSRGENTLLAKGKEFLGFLGQGESGSIFIYRADYFPEGFRVVRSGARP